MSNYNVFTAADEPSAPMAWEGQDGGSNTGTYKGFAIRIKGDGSVESIGSNGRGFIHNSVINAKEWIDTGGGAPSPEPGEEPSLASIDPTEAEIGSEDIVMTAIGTNFTPTSLIYFNGGAEATTFVSDTELTTGIKPSLVGAAIDVPVWVQQGSVKTEEQTFSFTEPA